MGKINKSSRRISNSGLKVTLDGASLYRTPEYPENHQILSGDYFLYDGKEINGRYAIVSSRQSVGFRPAVMVVIGYISKDSIEGQLITEDVATPSETVQKK